MKLRNKKTGEIVESACIGIFKHQSSGDCERIDTEARSLAKVLEYWEDYTPQEPLIEDEKIRKAVRAWVNANRWTDDVRLEFNDFGYHESWSLEQHTDNNEIHFSGRMPNCMHKQLYTITELCGEE